MVPNGWMQKKFGEVTSIGNGQVDPKIEPYLSMIHIGPENVVSNTGQIINIKSCKDSDLISGKYEFDENAIVYSKIRPNLNKVCKPDFNGVCSADMYPIWVNRDDLHKDYLFHYMLGPQFYKAAIAMSMRTGMPKINRNDLNTLNILLPPLAEQQKIAQILSTWDKAIAVTEQLLANSQQQKKALMQQLLTGKKRLLDENGVRFKGEWEEANLKDLCNITTGKKDVNEGNPQGVYPFFTCANEPTYSDSYSYDCEALLIAGNGSIGKTHYINGKFEAYQRTYILSSFDTKIQSLFLFQFVLCFLMKDIDREKQHGAMPYIKLSVLEKFKIFVPTLEEQQKIVGVLSTADQEIEALQRKLNGLQQEKKALMQQLLTGKRRVKVAA